MKSRRQSKQRLMSERTCEHTDLSFLIVDDSRSARRWVEHCLLKSGLPVGTVEQAGDGREAIILIRQQPFDFLVTDIWMPRMNGLDLIKAVRKLDSPVQPAIILASSEARDSTNFAACVEAGAMGGVEKPFTPESFKAELLSVIAARGSMTGIARDI